MKFIFALLFCTQSYAVIPYTADVNAATTNLATTYNTSYPQLTLPGITGCAHFSIINSTAKPICCYTISQSSSSAPTAGNGNELCVPATSFFAWDNVNVRSNVYCRSGSTTLTTGSFSVQAW